jgi:hypothetical protein
VSPVKYELDFYITEDGILGISLGSISIPFILENGAYEITSSSVHAA